jgi:hypothetical protein
MDGGYAENAGAFFGGCLDGFDAVKTKEAFFGGCLDGFDAVKTKEAFFGCPMDGGYAENAGAFFGRHGGGHAENAGAILGRRADRNRTARPHCNPLPPQRLAQLTCNV